MTLKNLANGLNGRPAKIDSSRCNCSFESIKSLNYLNEKKTNKNILAGMVLPRYLNVMWFPFNVAVG